MDDKKCGRVICFNFLLTPELCLVAAVPPVDGSWPAGRGALGASHLALAGTAGQLRQWALVLIRQLSLLELGTGGSVPVPGDRTGPSVSVSLARHRGSDWPGGKKLKLLPQLGLQPYCPPSY